MLKKVLPTMTVPITVAEQCELIFFVPVPSFIFKTSVLRVQENFSKTSRIQIFDLYPVVGYLVVRCFLIFFGGRFGRVSRGTLPILASIHAVLVELQRVLLLYKTFLLFFD